MRYSLEPKYRKYVKGYGFLSSERKFGDKYGKKLMDTATKTGIDAAKKIGDKYGKKLMIKLLHWVNQRINKKKKR